MQAEDMATTLNAQRFSRYRSVRRAAAQEPGNTPPVPVVPQISDSIDQNLAQINRAPSRYRRPTTSREHNVPLPHTVPAVTSPRLPQRTVARPEAIPEVLPTQDETVPIPWKPRHVEDSPIVEQCVWPVASAQDVKKRQTRHRSKTTSVPAQRPTARRRSYDAAREEARLILEGEYDRLQRLKDQQAQADKERKKRAEAKLAAQRADEERLQQEKVEAEARVRAQTQGHNQQRSRKWTIGESSHHTTSLSSAPQSPPTKQVLQPVQEPSNRQTSEEAHQARPEEVSLSPRSPVSGVDDEAPKKRHRSPTISRRKESHAPRPYEPKVGDGPPKTANNTAQTVDAPVSAVNASERRVEIRLEKSKITLPVTPTTTAKDLLNSASIVMSQPFDPRASVLVETYYPLGLERPLRRYEHIRDVMNSWDSDTQNYLMIILESECAARGLEVKDAPLEQPSHTMVHLHHSQRPGKWEKHWMILKSDGQVTSSKIENDGNATNVFHLSDFDVYFPSKKQLKKLRPPKKICFAIKSQQRSIVFESTENFVHMFCTNDKAVADQWFNAVQQWRSWYLVNVLGEGTAPKPVSAVAAVPAASTIVQPRSSISQSRDSVPYQLGTFQPLLDFSLDSFKYGEEGQSKPAEKLTSPQRQRSVVNHSRNRSLAGVNTNPNNLSRKPTTKRATPPVSNIPSFNQIQAAQSEEPQSHNISGPPGSSTDAGFTGKGLLARAFSVKKPTATSEDTPAYLENTDNAFTGKGLLSRKLSTRKFHNENQAHATPIDTNEAFTGTGLMACPRTANYVSENQAFAVPIDTNEAFTGGGLMARALTTKRSNIARRPGQPLVDLSGGSEFLDGSMLRQVEGYEMAHGQHLPVIDRSKNRETFVRTGEL